MEELLLHASMLSEIQVNNKLEKKVKKMKQIFNDPKTTYEKKLKYLDEQIESDI